MDQLAEEASQKLQKTRKAANSGKRTAAAAPKFQAAASKFQAAAPKFQAATQSRGKTKPAAAALSPESIPVSDDEYPEDDDDDDNIPLVPPKRKRVSHSPVVTVTKTNAATGPRSAASMAASKRQGRIPASSRSKQRKPKQASPPEIPEKEQEPQEDLSGEPADEEESQEEIEEEEDEQEESPTEEPEPEEPEEREPFEGEPVAEKQSSPPPRQEPELGWQSGPAGSMDEYDDNQLLANSARGIEQELESLEDAVTREFNCCICDMACQVGVAQETQRPYIMCKGDCKFPFLEIKQMINLHVLAQNTLEKKYRPAQGGTLPRCPRHHEIATLTSPSKANPQCHKIVGRLYFTCLKPLKEGGPCMVGDNRWVIPADVHYLNHKSPEYAEEKSVMARLFALNEKIKIQNNLKVQKNVNSIFNNALLDYKHKTGDFKPKQPN